MLLWCCCSDSTPRTPLPAVSSFSREEHSDSDKLAFAHINLQLSAGGIVQLKNFIHNWFFKWVFETLKIWNETLCYLAPFHRRGILESSPSICACVRASICPKPFLRNYQMDFLIHTVNYHSRTHGPLVVKMPKIHAIWNWNVHEGEGGPLIECGLLNGSTG